MRLATGTLSLFLLVASCGPAEWVEVRPEEAGFSIQMPAPPVERTQPVEITGARPAARTSSVTRSAQCSGASDALLFSFDTFRLQRTAIDAGYSRAAAARNSRRL